MIVVPPDVLVDPEEFFQASFLAEFSHFFLQGGVMVSIQEGLK
jgi:hypothetical protein